MGLNESSIVSVPILLFISLVYYLKITFSKILGRSYFVMMQGPFLWQNIRPFSTSELQ
jgi:hypothetical protein